MSPQKIEIKAWWLKMSKVRTKECKEKEKISIRYRWKMCYGGYKWISIKGLFKKNLRQNVLKGCFHSNELAK